MSGTNQQPFAGVAGSPSGVVVTRTLNMMTLNAGSPVGVLAGQSGNASTPPDIVWDWQNQVLWICTGSGGTPAATTWTQVAGPGSFTNLVVSGSLTATGAASFLSANISTTLVVAGGGSINGAFTGNPTWSGNPTFSGTPVFSGAPNFSGNPTFGGNPSFSGNPTFGGTPTFSGAPNFSGNPTFGGNPAFSGAPTFTSIGGSPTIPGTPNFTGAATGLTASVADNSTKLATTALVTETYNNDGRNYVHNNLFRIAQRGLGPFTSNGYTLDRWLLQLISDTDSLSQVNLSAGNQTAIGDEWATVGLQNVVTGNAAAGAFSLLQQRIEAVRRLSNKTVTVSFWAWAAAGTPSLGVSIDQIFGTGGSPSGQVSGTGQAVVLSTTPTRYSLSFNIPSSSGKNFGTNADDATALNFWFSSGSTNATRAGVGVQSGTFVLWGVQLEVTPSPLTGASPLEKRDFQRELSNCQRYFIAATIYVTSSSLIGFFSFPTQMRATPSITGGGAGFGTFLVNSSMIACGQTTGAAQAMTFAADL